MDKILSEIKNATDKVVKKSGDFFELSKIKISIANTKSSIDVNFKNLGEVVYHAQKSFNDVDHSKVEEIINSIDKLYEKLAEYDDIAAGLSNKKLCPECHCKNNTDAIYCSKCGFSFGDNE